MIKVIIDNVEFETPSTASIAMSFDAKTMCDVDSARDAVDVEVEIISGSLFAGEGYLHAAERFNASQHTAQLCYESVVVFEGDATLRSATRDGESVIYKIRIRRNGATWAENAATELLSELPVEYQTYLTEYNIAQSWSNDDIVKYFPVHRDSYSEVYSTVSSDVVNRVLSVDEYHPFINIYKVLDTIFTNAGYSVESSIMESDWFKKLYMSGGYRSQESEAAYTLMDFYVTKLTDVSATADYRGRVSMTPYVASNTVGNFVDVESIDENSECYSRSSCLSLVDGVVRFTPLTQISVGFEYRFRYTTDYTIKSRTELTAFDTFYLESGGEICVGVANNFVDQRSKTAVSNFEYKVVIFDYAESALYKVNIYEGATLSKSVACSSVSTTFTSPIYSDASSVSYSFLVSYDGGASYSTCSDDWALYQGYVALSGETEVDVTIRTSPETISPSSPKSFGGHYVDGAETGMKFTLLAGTTLTPYFASYPGVGASVDFEEVSQLSIYQSSVISSIQHLFNLRIFTDHMAQKVYIETLDELYNRDQLWDWTEKIVEGEQIIYEDVANDLYKIRRWGYQQADGASTRAQEFGYEPGETYPDAPEDDPEQSYADSWSTEYGSWSVEIGNYGAVDSLKSTLNPLFSPTLNDTNGLPIVGDREDEALTDTLEFSPRILSFIGMQSSGNDTIPYTAFHSSDDDMTLCFEDRDGVEGLNKYYQGQISRDESSQYITLSLRLSPLDIAALLSPVGGMASVMSTFTFEIDGEWCECWMESILSYDLATGIALCKLLITK
ncbi:MAG: hypothetical protein SNH55_04405 [Rikenellaceae bacterium]